MMSRTERIAPLSGVVFFLLFILAALLVNNYSYLPPAADLQSFFVDGATRIEWAGYLGAISSVFLIWFAGSVRHSLRQAEGTTGRLSAVVGGALPIVLAGLMGAAAGVSFRTKSWPAWLAWSSAVVAVGSISPLRYIFSAADVLWILVVSVWLFRKQSTVTV